LARKPNYNFEKRKKELDRLAKKDAKREERRRRREGSPEGSEENPSTADSPSAERIEEPDAG
jgi:hypothetical protein